MKISNSKKQLAKIISENGGWRGNAEWAAQDGDGEVGGYEVKPDWSAADKHWFMGTVGGWFFAAKTANYQRTRLHRDEYFHLYPAPDADGWVEWNGGECPVGAKDIIDVKLRAGETLLGWDSAWRWVHDDCDSDIIAYRLRKQEHPTGIEPTDPTEPEPTIEQLASDYRAKLSIAQQAQEEADLHRCVAEVALENLVAAGKALGLVLAVVAPEPALVITDCRDLQAGDVVWIGGIDDRIGAKLPDGEYEIAGLNEECDTEQPFSIEYGGLIWWPTITKRKWRFIRRP